MVKINCNLQKLGIFQLLTKTVRDKLREMNTEQTDTLYQIIKLLSEKLMKINADQFAALYQMISLLCEVVNGATPDARREVMRSMQDFLRCCEEKYRVESGIYTNIQLN